MARHMGNRWSWRRTCPRQQSAQNYTLLCQNVFSSFHKTNSLYFPWLLFSYTDDPLDYCRENGIKKTVAYNEMQLRMLPKVVHDLE